MASMAGSTVTGERAASPGSGSAELVAAAAYGEGEVHLLRSLDYPCTRRLRLRRLLAYHRRYTYEPIYDLMKERMHVIFHVEDFMKLIKTGQWLKAGSYMIGFFSSDLNSPEAKLLFLFFKFIMSLDGFANGVVREICLISGWILNIYREPVLVKYPCLANLVADVLFLRSDHASASLNWVAVRKKAAELMGDMVRKTPEFRGKLNLPRGLKDLYHIVPIQCSFGRHRTKDVRIKQPALALAQFFLQTKKRLPSSESQGASHTFSGSEKISGEQLMELLDEALKAGSSSIMEQGHIPEHFRECFPLVQTLSKPPYVYKILEIKGRKLSDSLSLQPQDLEYPDWFIAMLSANIYPSSRILIPSAPSVRDGENVLSEASTMTVPQLATIDGIVPMIFKSDVVQRLFRMSTLWPIEIEPIMNLLYQIDEECVLTHPEFRRVPAARIYNLLGQIQEIVDQLHISVYCGTAQRIVPAELSEHLLSIKNAIKGLASLCVHAMD